MYGCCCCCWWWWWLKTFGTLYAVKLHSRKHNLFKESVELYLSIVAANLGHYLLNCDITHCKFHPILMRDGWFIFRWTKKFHWLSRLVFVYKMVTVTEVLLVVKIAWKFHNPSLFIISMIYHMEQYNCFDMIYLSILLAPSCSALVVEQQRCSVIAWT